MGQLLYYYDSCHFFDYLYLFRSEAYEHHVKLFKGEQFDRSIGEILTKKQWDLASRRMARRNNYKRVDKKLVQVRG